MGIACDVKSFLIKIKGENEKCIAFNPKKSRFFVELGALNVIFGAFSISPR